MDRQYRRVSTEEQEKGTSLDWQLAKLAEVAPNAIDYCDIGYTGTNGNRPDFLRLLNDTQPGDRVCVTKLDRLARNLRLLLEIEAKFRDMNVPLISITENIDTSTAFGRMLFQILGVVAEWERETIIERTKSGRYARYREGKWAAGRPLYGYRYVSETKGLEIREDEARVVRRIYTSYLYEHLSVEKIGRLLNSEGIRTRRGKMFHKAVIREILKHPGYKGEHPTGAKFPVIIKPELWSLAQKKRLDNTHLHRRRESPWLLQGIMHCGLCGHVLRCDNNRRRLYVCRGRRQGCDPDPSHKCKLPSLPAAWLENEVFKTVMDTLSKPEGMGKAIGDTIQLLQVRRDELEATVQPIQDRLANIDRQLTKLAEDWVSGAIGEVRVNEMRGKLEAERERLSAIKAEVDPGQIDQLAHVKEMLKLYGSELERIKAGKVDGAFYIMEDLPSIGEPGSALTDGDVTKAKRAILDRFQAEIWVFPDRVEIKGRVLCPVIPIQEFSSTSRTELLPVKLILEIKRSTLEMSKGLGRVEKAILAELPLDEMGKPVSYVAWRVARQLGKLKRKFSPSFSRALKMLEQRGLIDRFQESTSKHCRRVRVRVPYL